MPSLVDWAASYRQKRGEDFIGYVANLTETGHPDKPFQLMVDLQTEFNTNDDAVMLAQSLPYFKKRTVVEMYTDGRNNSPTIDPIMRHRQVEPVQTAIRGRQPDLDKLNLADFVWRFDWADQPLALVVPTRQGTKFELGRQPERYIARFDPSPPTSSSLPTSSTPSTKPTPPPVLHFSHQQLDLALCRQYSAQVRTQGQPPGGHCDYRWSGQTSLQ